MSVLFKALSKASREHRKQKQPAMIPLLTTYSYGRKSRIVGACLIACLIIAAFLVGALGRLGDPREGDDNTAGSFLSDTMALGSSSKQGQFGRLSQTKIKSDEPQGIALSVESLSPEIEEVAQQLQDLPVSSETTEVRKSSARIVVSTENESPVSKWLSDAQSKLEEQDYTGAANLYEKVLAQDSNNQTAWLGKIFVLEQDDTLESLDELQQISVMHPDFSSVHAALARRLMLQGEMQQAMAEWLIAVKQDPNNNSYRLSLAILHDRMGQDEEALELYRKIKPLPLAAQQRMNYLSEHSLHSDQ